MPAYQSLPANAKSTMTATAADLILFDCDGVLIDSEVIACDVEAEILGEIGHPITREAFAARFIGTSRAHSLAALAADWGRPLPPDYAARVGTRLDSAFRTRLQAISGMPALVGRYGERCAVASSSSRDRLALTLGLTGLSALFGDRVFSAEQVARGKPAPDLFLFAAAELATAPDRCVVVEDSPFGIAAARGAGMTAIGFVAGGHCGPDQAGRLIEAGAHAVVGNATELSRCLGALLGT